MNKKAERIMFVLILYFIVLMDSVFTAFIGFLGTIRQQINFFIFEITIFSLLFIFCIVFIILKNSKRDVKNVQY